jgi:gliding motility-associated protein GldE
MTPVLSILDQLFSPLSRPLQSLSHLLEDKLADKRAQISVDHLSQALELASQEDTTSEEKKLLEGIVTFGNTETRQVMRPRIDIFGLKSDLSYAEVLQRVTEKGYSRVPVFEDSMDKILGVLFIKDLLPHLDENDFEWQKLLRAPFFVPENKKLDDLLVDFQNQKTHLAIVVDEYGGTSGVITLEDVIEEIVGDISDEYDDIDLVYSRIDDYTYVFEGKTSLKDFYRVAELGSVEVFEEFKGESETLAGFVLEITKGFPKRGEIIRFKGYTLTVESIDNRRIKQIKIGLPKTAL